MYFRQNIFTMKYNYVLFFLLMTCASFAQPCKTIVGYYPSWQWYDRANLVRPATIDYSKYSIINYAFLIPAADGSIVITDPWSDKNLLLGSINWAVAPTGYDTQYDFGNPAFHNPNTSLISYAHAANVKVMISLGGFTQSHLFPSISADQTKRTNFAHHCNEIIRSFNCDGIDIDWEYPGDPAQNGTDADTQNFTLLLQEVRDSLDALEVTAGELLLTSAFSAAPEKMENIEWSEVLPNLDYVNLMSYDFFGTWDATTNHNSPLYAPLEGDPDFNLAAAVNHLIVDHGVPSSKINAGVAFYGRSAVTSGIPILFGTSAGYADQATFSMDEGTPQYYNVLQQMDLFQHHWDDDAKVPYLTGLNNLNTFVSYDDESSIIEKGHFIVNNNLAGAIIWEITGDYIETSPGSGIVQSTPLANALNDALCALPSIPLDCEHMCVLDIALNPETNLLEVTIQNGSEQINYPSVVVIVDGDTVANIQEQFFLFAQLPEQTVVHEIPTTLLGVPDGFMCTVSITDNSYETFCLLEYPCTVNSVGEVTAPEINIFPNPASDFMTISSSEPMHMYRIFDVTGKLIATEMVYGKTTSMDIADLGRGLYVLEVTLGNGSSKRSSFEVQ
jgi:GH18 family chitinase